jgi:hypothetical protein
MVTRKQPKRLHPVNVRLNDEILEELRTVAAEENRSVSNLIFTILREWLGRRRKGAGKDAEAFGNDD